MKGPEERWEDQQIWNQEPFRATDEPIDSQEDDYED